MDNYREDDTWKQSCAVILVRWDAGWSMLYSWIHHNSFSFQYHILTTFLWQTLYHNDCNIIETEHRMYKHCTTRHMSILENPWAPARVGASSPLPPPHRRKKSYVGGRFLFEGPFSPCGGPFFHLRAFFSTWEAFFSVLGRSLFMGNHFLRMPIVELFSDDGPLQSSSGVARGGGGAAAPGRQNPVKEFFKNLYKEKFWKFWKNKMKM